MSTLEEQAWKLVREEISVKQFESWVYDVEEDLEAQVGLETHLRLLEARYESPAEVFAILDPWAAHRYNVEVSLAQAANIVRLCRQICLGSSEGLLVNIRKLLGLIPESLGGIDRWSDDAWSVLSELSDHADMYPVGVDESRVAPAFLAKMREFEDDVHDDACSACKILVTRHGNPPQDAG